MTQNDASEVIMARHQLFWRRFIILGSFVAVCLGGCFLIYGALGWKAYPGSTVSVVSIVAGLSLVIPSVLFINLMPLYARQPSLPFALRVVKDMDYREFPVLLKWMMRGDLIGGRPGRTRCHCCDYPRGAAMVCPECGAERIDPLPESTDP